MNYKGFTRPNLILKDYVWNDYEEYDNRVSGEIDDTEFDRNEGNEVLYMINTLMGAWGLDKVNNGQKIERMIKSYMPYTIKTQREAKEWIKNNWALY